jgi:predicted solute-binding protein
MPQSQIQLGWIPYWNLLPMHRELQRIAGSQLKVMSGHPSFVNRLLAEGSVQLAPASSIALLKSRQLDMALPLGIASEGPVLSVYLGLQREHDDFFEFVKSRQIFLREKANEAKLLHPNEARRQAKYIWSQVQSDRPAAFTLPGLKLTTASAASSALTRVLMHLWLGADAAHQLMIRAMTTNPSDGGMQTGDIRPLELVIGDEALQRRHEFWKVLDLGQIWFELTDLPFVFGLWQTNQQSLPAGVKALLFEAASLAQARMRVEPQIYFPETRPMTADGKAVDLAGYWKVIQYKLSDRHLRALLLYYALYHEISPASDCDWISERFHRWNQAWQSASLTSH